MKLNIVTYMFALIFVMLMSMLSSTITTYIFQQQEISDYRLIQEISKRLEEKNGYKKDVYDCVHYADDLQNIAQKLDIGVHQMSGRYNNNSPGHRVNCIEYDAQKQQYTNLQSKFDKIIYRD